MGSCIQRVEHPWWRGSSRPGDRNRNWEFKCCTVSRTQRKQTGNGMRFLTLYPLTHISKTSRNSTTNSESSVQKARDYGNIGFLLVWLCLYDTGASLYSPGYSGTCPINQSSLKLRGRPASVSQQLRLGLKGMRPHCPVGNILMKSLYTLLWDLLPLQILLREESAHIGRIYCLFLFGNFLYSLPQAPFVSFSNVGVSRMGLQHSLLSSLKCYRVDNWI